MEKEIHVYYHVCLINNGLSIASDQMYLLYRCGLLDAAKSINIGVKYDSKLSSNLPKFLDIVNRYNTKNNILILYVEENNPSGDHELMTSRYFKSYADSLKDNEDHYILYFHTKGVSRYGTPLEISAKHWRTFMEYFTINKWKNCYDLLDSGYESCGTFTNNMSVMDFYLNKDKPTIATPNCVYYPGTFYWIKSSIVKKISKNYFTTRNEYRVHAIEALPGLIEHRHFAFKQESRDLYTHIILPNEYI